MSFSKGSRSPSLFLSLPPILGLIRTDYETYEVTQMHNTDTGGK